MANNSKKYVSLTRLSDFLDNIKEKYSQIGHKHVLSDITDYVVDTELSSTSNNPVANSIIDAEFEAISEALNVYDAALDDKANISHNHDDIYYTETEIDNMEFITVEDIDTICGASIQVLNLDDEVIF